MLNAFYYKKQLNYKFFANVEKLYFALHKYMILLNKGTFKCSEFWIGVKVFQKDKVESKILAKIIFLLFFGH